LPTGALSSHFSAVLLGNDCMQPYILGNDCMQPYILGNDSCNHTSVKAWQITPDCKGCCLCTITKQEIQLGLATGNKSAWNRGSAKYLTYAPSGPTTLQTTISHPRLLGVPHTPDYFISPMPPQDAPHSRLLIATSCRQCPRHPQVRTLSRSWNGWGTFWRA
jgi:hypothetical protein